MSRRRTTQPPLFAEPCLVCRYPTPGEHEPYCPSFMRGAEPGGDPHEWPTLLDELEQPAAPVIELELEPLDDDAGTHPAEQRGDEAA